MSNKRVYFCDVDYLYTKKSPEFEKLMGGAVYVFVKAFDVREALELLLKNLVQKELEPLEVVSMTPYDINQEWETEEQQVHFLLLYKECEVTGQVVYDDFMAYKREE